MRPYKWLPVQSRPLMKFRFEQRRHADVAQRWAASGRHCAWSWGCNALVGLTFAACAPSLPPPERAAADLANAVERGDAVAVHALLDSASRNAVTVEEVASMIDRGRPQLLAVLGAAADARTADVRATVVLEGGETVELAWDAGAYYVDSTSALPASAATPLQAVEGLRAALVSRSYAALMAVLSTELAEQLEHRLLSLVEALRYGEVLDVQVDGDQAVIDTLDGHRVELELEDGSWKISDFE